MTSQAPPLWSMPMLPEGRVLPVLQAPDPVLGTPGATVDPAG